MRRTKEDAEKTKQSILDSAVQIFNEEGFANASLEHIARNANCTRGAVYHHFGSKIELFRDIRKKNQLIIDSIIEKNIEQFGYSLQTVKICFVELCTYFQDDMKFRAVLELLIKTEMNGLLRNQENLLEEFTKDINQSVFLIKKIVEIEKLKFKRYNSEFASNVAWSFISMFLGMITLWSMNNNLFDLSEHASIFIDNYINVLLNENPC